MTFSYFPGCTLKTKGARLDRCAQLAAKALGFTLEELPEWQCCGAVYPMARDEVATRLSSVRALVQAKDDDRPLVTLCSACHHVIKRVNGDMKNDLDIRTKVNNYLQLETPYAGETEVLHYLEVLRDKIGWNAVKAAVKKPLTGRKIGAYYGCLLLRPSRAVGFDDPDHLRRFYPRARRRAGLLRAAQRVLRRLYDAGKPRLRGEAGAEDRRQCETRGRGGLNYCMSALHVQSVSKHGRERSGPVFHGASG